MNRFENITDEKFIEVFNNSESKGDICRKLNIPNNGTSIRFINNKINELNLDMNILKENHFNKYHIKKVCPVCDKEFFTTTSTKDSKQICCSYACSNTYFRSGENNGMFKGIKHIFNNLSYEDKEKYILKQISNKKHIKKINEKHKEKGLKQKEHIEICFKKYPHKCCICGEENVVAVHHYDGNHFNNEISNLIPLCPTHHTYMHTKKLRTIIQNKVDEYRNNFIKKNGLIS